MLHSQSPTQKITLNLATDLLAKIEAAAKASYCNRSEYIRLAVVQRLNQEKSPDIFPEPKSYRLSEQSEDEFLRELTKRYTRDAN